MVKMYSGPQQAKACINFFEGWNQMEVKNLLGFKRQNVFAFGVAIFVYEIYNAPLIGPDEEL